MWVRQKHIMAVLEKCERHKHVLETLSPLLSIIIHSNSHLRCLASDPPVLEPASGCTIIGFQFFLLNPSKCCRKMTLEVYSPWRCICSSYLQSKNKSCRSLVLGASLTPVARNFRHWKRLRLTDILRLDFHYSHIIYYG